MKIIKGKVNFFHLVEIDKELLTHLCEFFFMHLKIYIIYDKIIEGKTFLCNTSSFHLKHKQLRKRNFGGTTSMAKIKNMGIKKLAAEMTLMNNDDVVVVNISGEDCLATFIPAEKLKFPVGYYYNEKNGVTNKHNTADGSYECFSLYKLSEF